MDIIHSSVSVGFEEQLQNVVKTAHQNPVLRICVHSDASNAHWVAAVTQCKERKLMKSILDQEHQPLTFLSAPFPSAQEHWSTYQKEAFAIVETFRRFNYLLACSDNVTSFTDHRNLLFIFHPTAVEPFLGRHKVLKVIRWAFYLSAFSYTIEHILGRVNTVADSMTKWMRGYRSADRAAGRISRLRNPSVRGMVPTAPPDLAGWSSCDNIGTTQTSALQG